MRIKSIGVALACLVVAGFITTLSAQTYELHPYIGHFSPRQSDDFGKFKNEGIYGLKGSVNLTPGFELEGNFGYINHFELEGTDPTSRGLLWEAAGNVDIPLGNLHPFVTGGVGGMTAVIDADVLDPNDNGPISAPIGRNRFDDGDTFFVVSYGGGIKANRLWGPMGLRFDVKGRTLPNIFGSSLTWVETTGGLTFSWGE